jgi:putative ABC transport system permease protein
MSLSGFLLKVLKANKRIYLKGLNMFVLRQINSKINTNFVSMTVICIMLLVTIGALSSGIGMASAFSGGIKEATPFDASIISLYDEKNKKSVLQDGEEITKIIGDKLDEISDEHVEISLYQLPIKYGDIFFDSGVGEDRKLSLGYFTETGIVAMKLSDYNSVLKMQGKEEISLPENEYIFNCNYDAVKEYYDKSKYKSISLDGREYKLYKDDMLGIQYETYMTLNDFGTFVLPDKALEKYKPAQKVLNINYKGNAELCEEKFKKEIFDGFNLNQRFIEVTAKTVRDQSISLKVMVSYIAIYIGLVFLITSVAVLALQQLSESSDNVERYALLREIGAEERMINRALFAQIFIYFMMPLALAIVHSIVGLYVANRVIMVIGRINIAWNTVIAAIIFLAIYGIYFAATFLSCKGMIREKSKD